MRLYRFMGEPINKTRTPKEFLLNREIEHINRHGISVFELILLEFCIMFLATNSCKGKADHPLSFAGADPPQSISYSRVFS